MYELYDEEFEGMNEIYYLTMEKILQIEDLEERQIVISDYYKIFKNNISDPGFRLAVKDMMDTTHNDNLRAKHICDLLEELIKNPDISIFRKKLHENLVNLSEQLIYNSKSKKIANNLKVLSRHADNLANLHNLPSLIEIMKEGEHLTNSSSSDMVFDGSLVRMYIVENDQFSFCGKEFTCPFCTDHVTVGKEMIEFRPLFYNTGDGKSYTLKNTIKTCTNCYYLLPKDIPHLGAQRINLAKSYKQPEDMDGTDWFEFSRIMGEDALDLVPLEPKVSKRFYKEQRMRREYEQQMQEKMKLVLKTSQYQNFEYKDNSTA